MKEQLSCVVRGLVQGVGFRWFVQRQASALKLTGWVQNNYDGSVEVVAQGGRPDLESLLSMLRKGPRSAMVSDIEVDWTSPTTDITSFEIR